MDVFISHSSKDREIVKDIDSAFKEQGIQAWICDRDIHAGEVWPQAIMEAIEHCKLFLVVVTAASNGSRQVMREIEAADHFSRLMLIFMVDEVPLARGIQYFLNSVQWVVCSKPSHKPSIQTLAGTALKLLNRTHKVSSNVDYLHKGNHSNLPQADEVLRAGKEHYLRLAYEESLPLLLQASEKGSGQADYLIGRLYDTGQFFHKNPAKAERYYQQSVNNGCAWGYYGLGHQALIRKEREKAKELFEATFESLFRPAAPSDPFSCFMLGVMFESGDGIKANLNSAVQYYTKSAEQGFAPAQCNLGMLYQTGRAGTVDIEKAWYWQNRAATRGHDFGQHNVASMYKNGIGTTKDEKLAFLWYSKSAGQGFAMSQYELALMYLYGKGIEADSYKAIEWLQKSAAQGHTPSQAMLGAIHMDGIHVTQDYHTGYQWYELAANNGDATALTHIGNMYEDGTGLPRDFAKAADYYSKAANAGNAFAQYHLAILFLDGRGVPQDYKRALWYFRQSADQNIDAAFYYLGYMYEHGLGLSIDFSLAFKWYYEAALRKYTLAEVKVGDMLCQGKGVAKDYGQAYSWFYSAAQKGNENGKKGLIYIRNLGFK